MTAITLGGGGRAVDALVACAEACTAWAAAQLENLAQLGEPGQPHPGYGPATSETHSYGQAGEAVRGLVDEVRCCVEFAELCARTARQVSAGDLRMAEECALACGKHAAAHQDWGCAERCWAAERALRELLDQDD